MGTRVTSQAVPDAYNQLGSLARSKIKAVILAAPDIDADVFNRDIVPQMQATGIPLTLYASRADKALQISKQFNGKARIGQDPLLAAKGKKGIDVIDASSVKTDFTEHNYFGASPVMIRDFKAISKVASRINAPGFSFKRRPPAGNIGCCRRRNGGLVEACGQSALTSLSSQTRSA